MTQGHLFDFPDTPLVRRVMRGWLLAVMLLFVALSATTAKAATLSGLEGLGEPVSDGELREMRGKFITPGSISYFGIEMAVSWQAADGITTSANLRFNLDFAAAGGGQPMPQISISWTREGDPSMDVAGFSGDAASQYVVVASANSLIAPTALEGVSGATQANVIAGADNRARNSLTIAVVPVEAINRQGGGTDLSGPLTTQFSDGDSIQFQLGANGIGLAMTSGQGGGDFSVQRINSTLGQATQQIVLNSNNNNVFNSTSMIVGIDTLTRTDIIRIDSAMLNLKGGGI